jgi:hypothetical protein
MNKRIGVWELFFLVAVFAGCARTAELDTRTFELQSMPVEDALMIIEPYVYGDRPGAPGTASAMRGLLTVRETPDNLEKIARVLSEFDVSSKNVQLHVQLISANGARTADPAIADVEAELRRLFRFEGYALVAEGVLTGLEGRQVQQAMFDQRGQQADPNLQRYFVAAYLGNVVESGNPPALTLESIQLQSGRGEMLFDASVTVGIGHTVVLGTMQLPGNRALILTVRAELGN